MSPEKLNEAIVTFQQSKTFKCIKEGVVNMAVGKVRKLILIIIVDFHYHESRNFYGHVQVVFNL